MTALGRIIGLGLAVCLTLSVGCGQSDRLERFAVRGQVRVNGSPLSAGTIRLLPAEGTTGPAAVGVISAGHYEITRDVGPVLGRYRVEIEQQLNLAFAIDDEVAYAQAYASTRGRPIPPQPIPAKYNRRSELSAEILRDETRNTFEFDLQVPAITRARN